MVHISPCPRFPLDCGSLSGISSGSVSTGGSTTYGATATYTCDTGYTMTGSSTRTCTSSGTWDGSEPSCSLVGERRESYIYVFQLLT